MLHTLLVLLDGSPLAERALPHMRAIAEAFASEVTLLHVLEPEDTAGAGPVDPVDWQFRKMQAQSYLAGVSAPEGARVQPNALLLEGSPVTQITTYARTEQPDLVILSSHGNSGLKPWNISSVAQKIIYRAYTSFLLVRAYRENHTEEMEDQGAVLRYRRIMVALDGSKRAECVLPVAARLAEAHQAEVLLAHVANQPAMLQRQPPTPEESSMLADLRERNKMQVKFYLEQVAEQLAPRAHICLVENMSVSDGLLRCAESNEVDLVLMSAHGRSGENTRPYGALVSSFLAYGATNILVIQDLAPDEIEPTRAEIVATDSNNLGDRGRQTAYAQPANWMYR